MHNEIVFAMVIIYVDEIVHVDHYYNKELKIYCLLQKWNQENY